MQSHEKSFTSPRARGEAATMSFVLGTNPEGKERVKDKASRIPSSRIGSALGCMYVCMYVFIKLHITTQSGPVILVILCHSH